MSFIQRCVSSFDRLKDYVQNKESFQDIFNRVDRVSKERLGPPVAPPLAAAPPFPLLPEWEAQNLLKEEDLRRKFQYVGSFSMLSYVGGCEISRLQLAKMVNSAERVDQTVWGAFRASNPNLSLFRRLLARICYFLLYQTSILDGIVGSFFDASMRLVKKGISDREIREKCILWAEEELQTFFKEDEEVLAQFLKQNSPWIRNRKPFSELREKAYSKGLNYKNYESFSKRLLKEINADIPLFRSAQQIPIFGLGFKLSEFIFSLCVKRVLEKRLLPFAIELGLINGLESVQSKDFQIAMNKALIEQFEKLPFLLKEVQTQMPPRDANRQVFTNEKAADLIKKGAYLLRYEEISQQKGKDRPTIQNEIKGANSSLWNPLENGALYVASKIGKEGVHIGIDFLEKQADSGELLSLLFDLSNLAFSTDDAINDEQYRTEKEDLENRKKETLNQILDLYIPKSKTEAELISESSEGKCLFSRQKGVLLSTANHLLAIVEKTPLFESITQEIMQEIYNLLHHPSFDGNFNRLQKGITKSELENVWKGVFKQLEEVQKQIPAYANPPNRDLKLGLISTLKKIKTTIQETKNPVTEPIFTDGIQQKGIQKTRDLSLSSSKKFVDGALLASTNPDIYRFFARSMVLRGFKPLHSA